MSSQQKNKLLTAVAGAAGEHFVTAELLRRNYSAAMLYGNAKEYDILAIDQSMDCAEQRQLAIQVKTSQERTTSWKIGKREPYYDKNTFYIFVTLADFESPVYYIVPSKLVHDRAEARHSTPTHSGKTRSDDRKFILDKSELDTFRNKWENLKIRDWSNLV